MQNKVIINTSIDQVKKCGRRFNSSAIHEIENINVINSRNRS